MEVHMTKKILLSVPEVMAATSLGRTKLYEILKSGTLESIKVGGRRLVAPAALAEWVARLRLEGGGWV